MNPPRLIRARGLSMPMRQDCKYFESRSYPSGDTVRKCDLDLAPEAPWRCPADCESFTPRLVDTMFDYGTMVTPATPAEPESLGADDSIGALLDSAEDIVNSAGGRIRAEVEAERVAAAEEARRAATVRGRLGRLFRRRR